MKKATKTALILAGTFILAGIIAIVISFACAGFDASHMSTVQYEDCSTVIEEAFSDIQIHSDSVPVTILKSPDGQCHLDSSLDEYTILTADVVDGCLSVELTSYYTHWYQMFNLSFGGRNNAVTLYLPEQPYQMLTVRIKSGIITVKNGAFQDVDLTASSGTIRFSALSSGRLFCKTTSGIIELSDIDPAGDIELEASSGTVSLTSCQCNTLSAKCQSGTLIVDETRAEKSLSLEITSGSIRLKDADAPDMTLKAQSGVISGSISSDKQFRTKSGSGYMELPPSQGEEICYVEVGSGSARLTVDE